MTDVIRGRGLMLEQVRPITSQFHRRKRETDAQEEHAVARKTATGPVTPQPRGLCVLLGSG